MHIWMSFPLFLFFSFLFLSVHSEDCSNFNSENGCQSGSTITNPLSWANRAFQTPPRSSPEWEESFQDLNLLTGYAYTQYSAARDKASVEVYTNVNTVKIATYNLFYKFNDEQLTSNPKYNVDSTFKANVFVTVYLKSTSDITLATLVLEPVEFIWNHPQVNQPGSYQNGQKGAIVELFGWPYKDVEKECTLLSKMGYLGVKVFPPNEFVSNFGWSENGEMNPWFFMYQPVSYKFNSRYGTREELLSMINTCRSLNVRVYADAVVNHMAGCGNDRFPEHRNGGGNYCNKWGSKNSTSSSPYYTHCYQFKNVSYTDNRPGNEFPAVPYGPLHFHCERGLNSWTDPFQLNAGWLVGLADLNSEDDYVKARIADYLTDLLNMGFSGFRIDAAKHISPSNLAQIFKKFKDRLGGGDLPSDFIAYLEVVIGGEKDLLMCSDNDYSYGKNFEVKMTNAGLSSSDIAKIKIWSSDYPKEFPICGNWVIPSERLVAQNECHDDQFPGSSSRDMGDKGSILVKEKNVQKHRDFEKQLFSRTDGNWLIKTLLSSYTFVESVGAFGPPDGLSDCGKCTSDKDTCKCTKSVGYTPAYDAKACGYSMYQNGKWIEGTYTRVHRDLSIVNAMRGWMGMGSVTAEQVGLPKECDGIVQE